MKTNITETNTTPSVVTNSLTPAAIVPGVPPCVIGLDLGDRCHHVCVLDAAGQIVREDSLPNTRPALAKLMDGFPRATVAIEAGTHSPWISRYLARCGATVLIANPRKLHPIQHGTAQPRHLLFHGYPSRFFV